MSLVDSREAEGERAVGEAVGQVDGVPHHGPQVEYRVGQAEQDAESEPRNARLGRPIVGFEPPVERCFRTADVILGVSGRVVGLLVKR